MSCNKQSKRIIWIFGPGAVGKKTFISNCANDNIHVNLLSNLDVDISTQPTIIPIIVYRDRPFIGSKLYKKKRLNIIEPMYTSNFENCVVLIHGQEISFENLGYLKNKYEDLGDCYYLKPSEVDFYSRSIARGRHKRTYENTFKDEKNYITRLNKFFKDVQYLQV